MPLISTRLAGYRLSESAQHLLLSSWRPGTLRQYKYPLLRWEKFCSQNNIDPLQPLLQNVVEFLTSLFDSGVGYSAINTARSALSTILTCDNGRPIGEHPLICRLLKGVFEQRPSLPKHTTIWDVGRLLDYLRTLSPVAHLSLKELSLKTVTLMFLLTGQRCQTIHAIDIRNIQQLPNMLHITISQPLKTTKAGKHQAPLELLAYPSDINLCIVTHLKEYLKRTENLRTQNTALFISFQKPHAAVTRETVSRWVKSTMKAAGIDTTVFKAHSCRAASTSAAKTAGLPLRDIIASAGWHNAETFARFYCRSVQRDNFGQHVISHVTPNDT